MIFLLRCVIGFALGYVSYSACGIPGVALVAAAVLMGYVDGCLDTPRKPQKASQDVDVANHQG